MSNKKTDWKSKYYELRSKHINAIDVSFRLGFQEGLKTAEIQFMQMQLQQAQQQAAAAASMGGGQMPPEAAMGGEEMPPEAAMGGEGMPPEGQIPPEAAMGGEEMPPEEMEEDQGDELGASIDELEKMVSKNEKIDFSKMLKSFHKSKTAKQAASELSDKHKKIEEIIKKWEDK
jgi:hypothetical protein